MTTASTDLELISRIDFSGGERLGRGKIELLEQILATGSISAAGRVMGMSYRRSWLLVDALNHMFDEVVVKPRRGGKTGVGAVVTQFGRELLLRIRDMERKMKDAVGPDLVWIDSRRNRSSVPEAAF